MINNFTMETGLITNYVEETSKVHVSLRDNNNWHPLFVSF